MSTFPSNSGQGDEPSHHEVPMDAESSTPVDRRRDDSTVDSKQTETNTLAVTLTTRPSPPVRTRLFLPSADYSITRSAYWLYLAAARMLIMFVHAGVVVEIMKTKKEGARFNPITPSMVRSRFEIVGELWRDGKDNKGKRICRPSKCTEDDAKALLATREALDLLPHASVVAAAPILTMSYGKPTVLRGGYHAELDGVFVTSNDIHEGIPVAKAANSLVGVLRNYYFQTPSDKARAIALLLTPALVYGRLLGDVHVPMFLVEANKSQAGKGLLLDITSAIYSEKPAIVVSRNGGVGSSDEDFNSALLRGCPMIIWDNLRGTLNSPHLESFLTAPDMFATRGFRREPIDVDPRRYILLATSNGFESTPDLAERLLRIGIYKRRADYKFGLYNKALIEFIERRRGYYLGCVFSVISEWISQGRPRTNETRHTFREWSQSIDWILLNLFSQKIKGRLMDYTRPLADETDAAAALGFTQPD